MFVLENKNSFFLVTRDTVLLDDDRDMASEWSGKYIQKNPALRWILGKYVEADNANSNKQYWSLADLQLSRPTVNHAPLNILHRPKHIVGAFVASEMIYPVGDEAAEEPTHPYVEALAAFWRVYFPEELAIVEAAYNSGTLAYSMECVAEQMVCGGENGCGMEFAYAGPKDESYCEHLNSGASNRHLKSPHFLAGALIIPPTQPGWKKAQITELSRDEKKYKDYVYASIQEEVPEGDPQTWESMMDQLILQFEESKKKKKKEKMGWHA